MFDPRPSRSSKVFRRLAPACLAALGLLSGSAAAQTLPNGGSVSGSISFAGDIDSYSFSATAGEGLQIQVGDLGGGALWPALRLYGPTGALIQTVQSSTATGVALVAPNTGTYSVEIFDWYTTGTGNYSVHFARVPGANEGGALANDAKVSSSVELADLDSYTFTATAGEYFQLQVADTTGGLWPAMRVYGPGGELLQTVNGSTATGVARVAGTTGTYTVVLSDWYLSGTGDYDLYFTRQPGASEHGELVNGSSAAGKIDLADLDSYRFDAVAGEGFIIQVADTSGGLWPAMRLFDPSGALVQTVNGSTATAIARTAGTTGTYSVVISDWYLTGTGDYDLYFSLRPGSNEGGALPNGGSVSGTIDLGDVDSYTFSAVAGESFQLQVANTSGPLWPAMRLYGPSGGLLNTVNGSTAAGLAKVAGTTGTYTVVISDWYITGTGDYDLYFAQMPGAGEHGTLANGTLTAGAIDLGDLDSYMLPMVAGEGYQIQVGEVAGGSLWPAMRLYDPNGGLVSTVNGSTATAMAATAGYTGTYTLVVSDWYLTGVGGYELHYARIPGANEGGALVNGGAVASALTLADLDSYTFEVTAGDSYELELTEIAGGSLWPAMRVYDPAGGLLQTANGSSGTTISRIAGATGAHTVVVSDWYLTGVGGYQLTLDRNLETYCTPGTSANGCAATIAGLGDPSATAASGFVLSAGGAEGDKDGLFFFGTNGRQANSWGNGTSFQCVVPPVKRGGILSGSGTTGLCDGAFSQDLNALWQAKPSKNPGAGAVVQAQLWYRDPQNTSNQTTSLSDAIEFTVDP